MLMSTISNRFAHQLLDARAGSALLPRLSQDTELSMADGYEVAKRILDIRIAEGEQPVGRKIGFNNRKVWSKFRNGKAVDAPIWATMYDSTVRYATDNRAFQSLTGAVQPRLEPEIVFKLRKAPTKNATLAELAGCIEWMAHGFEIVVCPFADWQFEPVDAVAAFGLHGSLIIGEPHMLSEASRRNLAQVLTDSSVSLSSDSGQGFSLRGAGFGADVLDSPVHALMHLHKLLQTQTDFAPLAAGEIITTGTWTEAYPVAAGETWTTAFSGVSLPGLTVAFV
ncbi:4-oxalocrotonate decarboxylase [Actimicrobium sp. CCC2.4]|uniref:2-keto-4-pentenoate hydratase n=1 Tax=Actimicrobium sp. CCC2.4 TaxID=3048606 RepID=UPI002AC9A895|nr:4-oxalocrotonate decarboxylase [Actimicrobium sp. CCC2.4]MEB0134307.1 4-oxalocrotonate decarboxylase [Actimicrobium sp. CCC2.4]WPX32950.1 4-oxalocrotonate decarboxylase [Actimicrobium sp. CCC2.4]